ncbi:NitT/TauT family transport system substrate-binding protein [Rathayibacter sp. PhB151]|uniref:ABC transporter substrate-binding protein n=1 Tax=Rathayibacter sp. PhB151 TaxID=2485189 RepID=UPI0010633A74|nr:ABC transporter substrate-binding protein [Rathayibacter sp. PhB151]TDX82276.1 NitT/TauT family transport system substrate-binding protein [Rathayibacter sp. PhB151]
MTTRTRTAPTARTLRTARPSPRRLRRALGVGSVLTAVLLATACTAPGEETVDVVIGYQSRTINTVTAGTLLRERGFFEKALEELGGGGVRYRVTWQDYDTGAPITAQMLAEKVDVGSMGDFPLVVNASTTRPHERARTELIAVTAYSIDGGLNGIVVPASSDADGIEDLRGASISTSTGSAGDGLLSRVLRGAGLAESDVTRVNQAPSVGASALTAGSVDAVSQFTSWPGLMVHDGGARLLVDGAATRAPTFHGVVVRSAFAEERPEVVDAFLSAMIEATGFLHADPLRASTIVAEETGLPVEVVHLYNGAGGIATFDPTLKQPLLDALAEDAEYLDASGVPVDFDAGSFADDSALRAAWGDGYDAAAESLENPAVQLVRDEDCPVTEWAAATASEAWPAGEEQTVFHATPECLLAALASSPLPPRAAYVPDHSTGTRWFADRSEWVHVPGAEAGHRLLPFATRSAAQEFLDAEPGGESLTYGEAVDRARAL